MENKKRISYEINEITYKREKRLFGETQRNLIKTFSINRK